MSKPDYDFNLMNASEEALCGCILNSSTKDLIEAFCWAETPQGEAYWHDVALEQKEFPLEVLEDLYDQYLNWAYPTVQEDNSNVEHPSHYNQAGIECIEAIKASLGPKGFQAYCKGNCMKYLWRYEYKNGLEDLKKAQVYLNWMVESYEGNA